MYGCMKTTVLNVMRKKDDEGHTELKNRPNGMVRLVGLKVDSEEAEGRGCMRGSDGKLCFSKK